MTDTQIPGAQTPGAEQPPEQPRSVVGLVLLVAGIVALGVLGSVSAVIVVIALLVMIFMHELGHYMTARASGMKVTEFFLGFGPRIWSFNRGETEYGLKAVPAGAYVRIIGMHNLDPVEPEDEPRAYKNKPYWRKMSVASAGSMMHFIMAAVLMFGLFATYGQRDPDNVWTVGSLSRLGDAETSPAIEAGIEVGDRIVAVDGIPVTTFESAVSLIKARPGQQVVLEVERDGETFETTTTLNDHNPDGDAVGFLGVGARYPYVRQTIPEAAQDTAVAFKDLTWGTIRALGAFFSPSGLSDYIDTLRGEPSGSDSAGSGGDSQGDRALSPVGAVRLASQAADAGLPELLWFLVVINMFVGIFNLIPLLPLDGGHIAIGTYEKIRSRKGRRYEADIAKLMPLTYAVVLFMGFVFLSSLWLDLADPLGNPFGQ
jgi:membrane-associated protease RseP (regulator of RpoE activity)